MRPEVGIGRSYRRSTWLGWLGGYLSATVAAAGLPRAKPHARDGPRVAAAVDTLQRQPLGAQLPLVRPCAS